MQDKIGEGFFEHNTNLNTQIHVLSSNPAGPKKLNRHLNLILKLMKLPHAYQHMLLVMARRLQLKN